jgi:hypothetical protein
MHVWRIVLAVMVSVLATFAVGVGTAAAGGDITPYDGVELVQH